MTAEIMNRAKAEAENLGLDYTERGDGSVEVVIGEYHLIIGADDNAGGGLAYWISRQDPERSGSGSIDTGPLDCPEDVPETFTSLLLVADYRDPRAECAVCAASGIDTRSTDPERDGWRRIPHDPVRDGLEVREVWACEVCFAQVFEEA